MTEVLRENGQTKGLAAFGFPRRCPFCGNALNYEEHEQLGFANIR